MEIDDVLDHYIGEGIITEVAGLLKTGKEAVVYRCLGGPVTSGVDVAVKIYKDIEYRSFRRMNDYLDGRIGTAIRKRRDILHMYADPATMQATWVWAEYEALKRLRAGGVPVPIPYGSTGNSLAMQFIADGEGSGEAAPRLRECRLPADEAAGLFTSLRAAVRDMLACDTIHGDLSPYNILYRAGTVVIIDLPQAVDARYNSQALAMLERDCINVFRYFERFGLGDEMTAKNWANSLWEDYVVNRLYA
ncbi:MAG: hypothetical protein A2087_03760 [Spirochaetes bacterium GWD1_61_31]|nr:MAG: hypothetical protein A2Y37_05330 [Spirochaetes bacterium GWB1_60_80]OHD33249.1 MAG: hypothetical protein A2004_09460 [Spirochaetes bacterium GWC1_61_12]OHD35081.1 MAG: hypothetical protein A2087_03760 [Spirochaetes bacterium GWD1_61_31]OHD42753.1 MAG: hypothetical protein A2Y35_05710 [Spirochaetes bacterium GWE1_60_18]OHD58605.1 MAG: hypothetical protein A2Y32_04635 [Spirochaetes bacterium GWF1_60_12]HAP44440.1 serine protein kinase RIO [Spirochaetaceae bacterium]